MFPRSPLISHLLTAFVLKYANLSARLGRLFISASVLCRCRPVLPDCLPTPIASVDISLENMLTAVPPVTSQPPETIHVSSFTYLCYV